jgi:hypothetical protein
MGTVAGARLVASVSRVILPDCRCGRTTILPRTGTCNHPPFWLFSCTAARQAASPPWSAGIGAGRPGSRRGLGQRRQARTQDLVRWTGGGRRRHEPRPTLDARGPARRLVSAALATTDRHQLRAARFAAVSATVPTPRDTVARGRAAMLCRHALPPCSGPGDADDPEPELRRRRARSTLVRCRCPVDRTQNNGSGTARQSTGYPCGTADGMLFLLGHEARHHGRGWRVHEREC